MTRAALERYWWHVATSCTSLLLFMAPCIADADIIFCSCGFFLLLFLCPQPSQIGSLPYFDTRCGLSVNLEMAQHSDISQNLWHATRNGITELLQKAPPTFSGTAIKLGISPHSSVHVNYLSNISWTAFLISPMTTDKCNSQEMNPRHKNVHHWTSMECCKKRNQDFNSTATSEQQSSMIINDT